MRHIINVIASLMTALSSTCLSAAAAEMTVSGTPPTIASVGQMYNFVPVISNANASRLEFNYINKPAWSGRYRGSGAIRGTPTEPGVYANIQIEAWDGVHYAASPPFTITVMGTSTPTPEHVLQIAGTPANVATVGQFYSFTPTVVTSPGASLTYMIVNKPAWATFSTASGTLSGTPTTESSPTDPNIVVSVSNGVQSVALGPFSISVEPPVGPPVSGGTASLSWSKPIQNTNGSPLTDLAGYVIRFGKHSAALDEQISIAKATITEAQIDNLSPGQWYFEIAAVNTSNVQSQFSAEVGKPF